MGPTICLWQKITNLHILCIPVLQRRALEYKLDFFHLLPNLNIWQTKLHLSLTNASVFLTKACNVHQCKACDEHHYEQSLKLFNKHWTIDCCYDSLYCQIKFYLQPHPEGYCCKCSTILLLSVNFIRQEEKSRHCLCQCFIALLQNSLVGNLLLSFFLVTSQSEQHSFL